MALTIVLLTSLEPKNAIIKNRFRCNFLLVLTPLSWPNDVTYKKLLFIISGSDCM